MTFLILSRKHSPWGNNAVWWRPDSAGYTERIDEAGRYSEAEALQIQGNGHDNVAVPVEDAEKAAHKVVSASDACRFIRGGILKP